MNDIWQDTVSGELIVVDYKSQAKSSEVNKEEYLSDPYHMGYKIQMDFMLIFREMGFSVCKTSYFLGAMQKELQKNLMDLCALLNI